jgi:hypothetical protein
VQHRRIAAVVGEPVELVDQRSVVMQRSIAVN